MIEHFRYILENYTDFYNKSSSSPELDKKMKDTLLRELPNKIIQILSLDENRYKVQGSYGMGNYTETPWISVFHKKITDGAQKGFYAVFLFKKDMSGFYLSINQGTTYLDNKFKGKKPRNKMKQLSHMLREDLNIITNEFPLIEIDLLSKTSNAKNYRAANICAKEYTLNELTNQTIIEDLRASIDYLEKIVQYIGPRTIDMFVDDLLFKEFIDDVKFQEEVLLAKPSNTVIGPQSPQFITTTGDRKVWKRDPSIAKEALTDANYKCEIDDSHETFISSVTKQNYVEAHHLIPMHKQNDFNYSIDVPGNIVSLCPNCHREIHHAIAKNKKEIISISYHQRKLLLKEYGLEIPIGKLLSYYDVE